MAAEYRQFKLKPGQQAPKGSTGIGLPGGEIVWIGKKGTFPKEIESWEMTKEEIEKHHKYAEYRVFDYEIDEFNAEPGKTIKSFNDWHTEDKLRSP